MPATRQIVFLADCDAQALNLVGPLEIFRAATKLGDPKKSRYRSEVVVPEAGTIRCSVGLSIISPRSIKSQRGPIDTLVVVGGFGVWRASKDRQLLAWIRRKAARARRVAFVESVRLEAAQRALEHSADSIDAVARRAGFGTIESLERRFQRALGVTPSAYRRNSRTGVAQTRAGRSFH